MTKKSWGTSKIEIIANKEEIEILLSQGHSYSEIYRYLYGKEKITISLRAFQKTMKRINAIDPIKINYNPSDKPIFTWKKD